VKGEVSAKVAGTRQILESVFDGVSGYIVSIDVLVAPLAPLVLPHMSSRLLKYVVVESSCFSSIRDVVLSESSFKPVTLFALRRGVRRLYSTLDYSLPQVAKAGEVLEGRIAVYTRGSPSLSGLLGCDEIVEFHGLKLRVATRGATIESVEDITAGVEAGKPFKLTIHTPLLLPSKLMTPPPLSTSKLAASLKGGYRLLPTPSYVLAAACREWIGVVRGERVEGHIAPYVIGRLADITIYELDANTKPVTTVYGRDEKGNLRLARGPIGYVIYKLETKKLAKAVDKLLALATRIGLGKSRSIGFGEIEVKPVEQ